jgi:hypothetical protein
MPGKSGSRKRGHHRAEREDYMMRVVPALPPREADQAFEAWLREEGIDRETLNPRDVDVRVVRTNEGDLRQYLVHYDAIRDARD